MSKADSLIGKQLDEYRLETLLGQGGMARVYRAVDTKLKRYAAVKVIDAQFRADSEYERRFELEAQSLGQIEHPNVVSLYRYGRVDDVLYMAMRYVEGSDLKSVLDDYHAQGEYMAVDEALRVLKEAAEALDYVHERGIIHRDVKPANLMLEKGGKVVLADFGLALMTEVGTMGEIFGTPQYLSPEQAISSAAVVPQSDLYSLGIIAYEIFTGRIPFDSGTAMDIALMQMNDAPPLPSDIRPELSEDLEVVLLKALEKEPSERYQTGKELYSAIESAVKADSQLKRKTTSPKMSIMDKVSLDLEKNPLPPLMPPAAVTPQQKKSVEMPSITERAADTAPNTKPPTVPHQAAETEIRSKPPQAPKVSAPPRSTTEQPAVKIKNKPNPLMQYAPYAIGGIIISLVLIIGALLLFNNLGANTDATATAIAAQEEALSPQPDINFAAATASQAGLNQAATDIELTASLNRTATAQNLEQSQNAANLVLTEQNTNLLNTQESLIQTQTASANSIAANQTSAALEQAQTSAAATQTAFANQPIVTSTPQASTSQIITLSFVADGDKWLLIRNVSNGTSLDLSALRISSLPRRNEGIQNISGLWFGQSVFLSFGQCVAYGKDNDLERLNPRDCDLIATETIEEGRQRFWNRGFEVYYDNFLNPAPIATCEERGVCSVEILVSVDG